ncbi:MAG TPA: hypothetical protein VNR17_10800 [Luteimicrobium sp.]|nr:hypothetical protein [Luteimicrobium sp.]
MTTQAPPVPPRPAVPEWKRVKQRRRRRDLVGLGVTVALIAGASAAYGVAHGLASGPLAVATLPKPPLLGSSYDDMLISGTLAGAVGTGTDEGTACFWFEGSDGSRSYVVWPHGWSADDHPLRILNDWGKPVATVGDRIEGGGASSDGAGTDDAAVKGCPEGGSTTIFGTVARAN